RVAPASGGATIDRPGMNLATMSARGPQRSKRAWVWLTHTSGVSEMRHSTRMTRPPKRRPARYQALSPTRQAPTASAAAAAPERRPSAASAPATIRVGTAGMGTPSCMSSTLRNTNPKPNGGATGASCGARGRATIGLKGDSARVLGEDRGHRRVDALLRLGAAHPVQALVHRGVPQRLAALGVVHVDGNDALAVHVRAPVARAPVTRAPVSRAPRASPAVVGVAPATVDHLRRADAVADQAVRLGSIVLDAAAQVRGDGAAQAGLVDGIGDGAAQRAVAVERPGPRVAAAVDGAGERAVHIGAHGEGVAAGEQAGDGGNEDADADQDLAHDITSRGGHRMRPAA